MVKRYQTQLDYRFDQYKPGRYEENTLPSETIPDETMSIREIFTRYANGQNLGAPIRPLSALQNPDLPINWDKMDISERYAFAAEHKVKLTEVKKAMDDQRALNEEEQKRQAIIAEYESSKLQNELSPASSVDDAKQGRTQKQKSE